MDILDHKQFFMQFSYKVEPKLNVAAPPIRSHMPQHIPRPMFDSMAPPVHMLSVSPPIYNKFFFYLSRILFSKVMINLWTYIQRILKINFTQFLCRHIFYFHKHFQHLYNLNWLTSSSFFYNFWTTRFHWWQNGRGCNFYSKTVPTVQFESAIPPSCLYTT